MIKKERVLTTIGEKRKKKQLLEQQIKTQENQIVLMEQSLGDINLEISLMEDYIKKREG